MVPFATCYMNLACKLGILLPMKLIVCKGAQLLVHMGFSKSTCWRTEPTHHKAGNKPYLYNERLLNTIEPTGSIHVSVNLRSFFLLFSSRTSGQANEGHPHSAKSTKKKSRPLGKWYVCRQPFTLPDLGNSGDFKFRNYR